MLFLIEKISVHEMIAILHSIATIFILKYKLKNQCSKCICGFDLSDNLNHHSLEVKLHEMSAISVIIYMWLEI